MKFLLKLKTGPVPATGRFIEQLYNEGKLPETLRCISIDQGKTWVTYPEACLILQTKMQEKAAATAAPKPPESAPIPKSPAPDVSPTQAAVPSRMIMGKRSTKTPLTFTESSYWWLWIPVIGWIPFAIPLVFPLGPILVGISFSNSMRFVWEAAAHNGNTLPDGTGSFIGGSYTLGYNTVWRTHRAAKKMLAEQGSDVPQGIPGWSPLLLPLYILCPALVYMPLIKAMRKHWQWHMEAGPPSQKELTSPTTYSSRPVVEQYCSECQSPLRIAVQGDQPTGETLCLNCHDPHGTCPFCRAKLRTLTANQCPACKRSWHKTVSS